MVHATRENRKRLPTRLLRRFSGHYAPVHLKGLASTIFPAVRVFNVTSYGRRQQGLHWVKLHHPAKSLPLGLFKYTHPTSAKRFQALGLAGAVSVIFRLRKSSLEILDSSPPTILVRHSDLCSHSLDLDNFTYIDIAFNHKSG
jgi:hypothetical protein